MVKLKFRFDEPKPKHRPTIGLCYIQILIITAMKNKYNILMKSEPLCFIKILVLIHSMVIFLAIVFILIPGMFCTYCILVRAGEGFNDE